MTTFTVTATQSGSPTNGMALVLKVVTGASHTQPGAVATVASAVPSVAITPQNNGSWVYGAILESGTGALTALANTTYSQNVTGNGLGFYMWRSTATTTAGSPVTYGAAGSLHGISTCAVEIVASGTLAEDASSPAASGEIPAETFTTASFTPPAGSLLVLMVATNGNTGVVIMTITDTSGLSLTWVQQESNAAAGGGYSGVWTAQIPSPPPITKGGAGATVSALIAADLI